MKYILLDLEWNSAYCHKTGKFINEIMQIGAVKLNEQLEECDRFSHTIKSCITKKLSKRFIDLTGITNEEMLSGVRLKDAVEQYNDWVSGDDFVTMTYSNSDLYAIFENCSTFLTNSPMMRIGKYADLQTLAMQYLNDRGAALKNQISLSTAAQMLGIDISGFDMHTAFDDSLVSSAILKVCFDKDKLSNIIKDTDHPDFYKRLMFKSHPITNLKDAAIDKSKLKFFCEKCGGKTNRRNKWKYSNRWFRADFECAECRQRFVGRVSFIKTYDTVVCKRKIIYPEVSDKSGKEKVQSVSETM